MSEMLMRRAAKLQRKLSSNSGVHQLHLLSVSSPAERPAVHHRGKLALSEVLQPGRKGTFSLKFDH